MPGTRRVATSPSVRCASLDDDYFAVRKISSRNPNWAQPDSVLPMLEHGARLSDNGFSVNRQPRNQVIQEGIYLSLKSDKSDASS